MHTGCSPRLAAYVPSRDRHDQFTHIHTVQKGIELAESALLDSNSDVRAAPTTALGQAHSTASIRKLRRALWDKEIAVALAAARALHEMNDKSACEVYYAILTGERKSKESVLEEQTATLHEPKKLEALAFKQGIGYIPYASMGWDAARVIMKDDSSPVGAAGAEYACKGPRPRECQSFRERRPR